MKRSKLTRRFIVGDEGLVDTDGSGDFVYAESFDHLQDILLSTEARLAEAYRLLRNAADGLTKIGDLPQASEIYGFLRARDSAEHRESGA
jgi:hypothetical protein